jgi:myo-inositol-1(or 4)-monophosphatase
MNIDFLIKGVQLAGEKAKINFEKEKYCDSDTSHPEVREMSHKELVIEEDLLCEQILVSEITRHDPNAIIYSEEMNTLDKLSSDTSAIKYILDPLDGTHNYYFGLPYWGIAAAVLNDENVSIAGVIFLPMMDLLLICEGDGKPTMIRGKNSWKPVSTNTKAIQKSLVCYDNQFYKMGERATRIYELLTKQCFTTRITGSAVGDSALIACGKINARVWNNTCSYDIAAGVPIVAGAVGYVCNFSGNKINVLDEKIIMCSDYQIQQHLIELIQHSEIK